MELELKKMEDPIEEAIKKLKEVISDQLRIAFEAGEEYVIESRDKK